MVFINQIIRLSLCKYVLNNDRLVKIIFKALKSSLKHFCFSKNLVSRMLYGIRENVHFSKISKTPKLILILRFESKSSMPLSQLIQNICKKYQNIKNITTVMRPLRAKQMSEHKGVISTSMTVNLAFL